MRKGVIIAGVIVGITCSTFVQQALGDQPSCKPHNFELGLFGGESYGLDRWRPMGGGNVAYGLSCTFFPFAEASYLPGILHTQDVTTGPTVSHRQYNINMTDVHAGLHIRLPRPESRVVPYAAVGFGLLRGSASTVILYPVSAFGSGAPTPSSVDSHVSPAFDFGGGLRFFLNERFAIRLEFKGFRPTSAPAPLQPHLFYRFAIGPVFQLR